MPTLLFDVLCRVRSLLFVLFLAITVIPWASAVSCSSFSASSSGERGSVSHSAKAPGR